MALLNNCNGVKLQETNVSYKMALLNNRNGVKLQVTNLFLKDGLTEQLSQTTRNKLIFRMALLSNLRYNQLFVSSDNNSPFKYKSNYSEIL